MSWPWIRRSVADRALHHDHANYEMRQNVLLATIKTLTAQRDREAAEAEKNRADVVKMLELTHESIRLHDEEMKSLRALLVRAVNERDKQRQDKENLQLLIRSNGDTAARILQKYWGKNAPPEPIARLLSRVRLDGFCMPSPTKEERDES